MLVLLYHFIRKFYYFILKLILKHVFQAEVTFKPGYHFFAVTDVHIVSNDLEILIESFCPVFNPQISIFVKNLRLKNFSMTKAKNIWKDAHNIVFTQIPALSFYHVAIDIDQITCENNDYQFSLKSIKSHHTSTFFSIEFKDFILDNDSVTITYPSYKHVHHFLGEIPKSVNILNPNLGIDVESNKIIAHFEKFVLFSQEEGAKWQLSVFPAEFILEIKKILYKDVLFAQTSITIDFPEIVNLSLINGFQFSLPYLRAVSSQIAYKISLKNVTFSQKQIQIEYYEETMNHLYYHFFLRIREMMKTKLIIDKLKLDVELNNSESAHIAANNFIMESEIAVQSTMLNLELFNGKKKTYSFKTINLDFDIVKSSFTATSVECSSTIAMRDMANKVFKFISPHIDKQYGTFNIKDLRYSNMYTNSFFNISDAEITIKMKERMNYSDAHPLFSALFPSINLNEDNDFVVIPYEFQVKSSLVDESKMCLQNAFFDGIIHLLPDSTLSGMINCTSSHAKFPSGFATTSDRWLLSYQLDELIINLHNHQFVIKEVKGNSKKFDFISLRSDEVSSGRGLFKLLSKSKYMFRFTEIKHTSSHFIRAEFTYKESELIKIKSELYDNETYTAVQSTLNLRKKILDAKSLISKKPLTDDLLSANQILTMKVGELISNEFVCLNAFYENREKITFSASELKYESKEFSGIITNISAKICEQDSVVSIKTIEGIVCTGSDVFKLLKFWYHDRPMSMNIGKINLQLKYKTKSDPALILSLINVAFESTIEDKQTPMNIKISNIYIKDLVDDDKTLVKIEEAYNSAALLIAMIIEPGTLYNANFQVQPVNIEMTPDEGERIRKTLLPFHSKKAKTKCKWPKWKFDTIVFPTIELNLSYYNPRSDFFLDDQPMSMEIQGFKVSNITASLIEVINQSAETIISLIKNNIQSELQVDEETESISLTAKTLRGKKAFRPFFS